MKPLTVYTAASFRLLHAVQLFHEALRHRIPDVQILDWTDRAAPPEGLAPDQRRRWFDAAGGQVYEFCADACANADVVVYLGASGQDAGVEVGLAAGAGTPVMGVRGPLEAPGLMLHGAVALWCCDIQEAVRVLTRLGQCRGCWACGQPCAGCKARHICNLPVSWRE